MKDLKVRPGQGSILKPVLLTLAALQLVLAGFMSVPGEKHRKNANDAALDIEVLINQVVQLNRRQEHQKAIELLLSAVDKQQNDSILRTLLVQTFDLFLEQEVKQGQKDILKNPRDINAYDRLAGALELLGDNFRAMEIVLTGISANPNAPTLWMKIARLELKANRSMEALDVFKEVSRLDKNNSDAYNNAAYILARWQDSDGRDLKEAELLANRARKLDPKNPEYLDTLAEVHFRQGQQQLALSEIEEAIKLAPKQESLKNQLLRFKGPSSVMAE